ncbi:hypothetical protein Bca101_010768 [Brassica carinata]
MAKKKSKASQAKTNKKSVASHEPEPPPTASVVSGKDGVWKKLFGKKKIVTIAELCRMLEKEKNILQGFPLTLQLVAFRAIPKLLSFIPAPLDQRTLMDLEDGYLPQHGSINSLDILRVEFSPDLAVSPVIPIESQVQPGSGEVSNDPKDDSVIYMEQLIADRYTFTKAMWPGGVTTEPLLEKPKDRGQRNGKKDFTRVKQSLKPKQVIKKETSSRKRRISSYFTPSSVTSFTNAQLTEIVLGLQKQMKQMHKLLKKKKSHGRQTSFHTLLSRCKKPGTSDHVEKEAPIEQDVPVTYQSGAESEHVRPLDIDPPTDQDVDAMEADEHPDPQSPIISQYAAHLHRQAPESMYTPLVPNSNENIHTTSVHNSADHSTNFVHKSPNHISASDQVEHVLITTIRPPPQHYKRTGL